MSLVIDKNIMVGMRDGVRLATDEAGTPVCHGNERLA